MKELKRLKIKFVASNMAMVTLVIGLAFLAIGQITRLRMEQHSEQALAHMGTENMQDFFSPGRESLLPYFVLITNRDDDIIRVEGQYRLEPEDEFLRFLAAESLSSADDRGFLEQYQLQYARRPFENGYMITYVDTSVGESYIASMWKVLGIIGAAVWAALFFVSCFLSRWAVAPVDQSIRREKQFVADASHELKTPLTVIMANAQLLSDAEASASGDERRWLSNICQEAAEMKKLVEEMLTLARNEAAGSLRFHEICSLSDIVTESALSFEAVFYQANKELDSQVEENIRLKGDEKQLRQLLRIFLDNAEKYSPDGSCTQVTLRRISPRKALLTVSNPGEAIPKARQKAIFDRFYRSDLSRSDRNGYGLGLAIAKSITENHRGKIRAESSGGLNHFSVELRVLPAA